ATVVARLLAACPRLVVLATSRERLNLDGEVVWRLSPLALPQTADTFAIASDAEAVRLFVDRARNARPGFDIKPDNLPAIVAICRRLDGMPLAIELAAARASGLSPAEIMTRLDDRLRLLTGGPRDADTRHRTLRAAIDWSYQLLDPSERTLLQRLSIFAGPIRADAVEQVCGEAPLAPADVGDGLQQLADKSMLQIEPSVDGATRYRLLETIRDYAAAKLAATGGETRLRDLHLAFYARLTEEAYEARMHRGAMPEHRRLWDEMADVRAALDFAKRDLDTEVGLLGNLPTLAMALASISAVELQRGNIDKARPWVQQALDVAAEADDDYGVVGAQYTFGWLEFLSGDTEAARRHFIAALDLVAESDALPMAQQVEGIASVGAAADPRRAVSLFGAASKLREEVETPVQLPWSIWLEPALAAARAALPEGVADRAW